VFGRTAVSNRPDRTPILLHHPVLSGGAVSPGLQEDIIIEFVNPRAGGPLAVQVLLRDMAGQFTVINGKVATFAAGKAVIHSELWVDEGAITA
jgi:hypothetical protein